MAIPQSFITELRERCDITEIIGSYVQLKRSGRLSKGLCPFHSEKTPSFTVFPDTASYYCFGCQSGGDVITFIRQIERLDYVEAVKLLASRAGMTMPEEDAEDGLAIARRRCREANREAGRFFYRQLYTPQGAEALAYLHGRGLTDETIRHFGLGWSPDSWDALSRHLTDAGFRADELVLANLSFTNRYDKLTDRFRNRVMFPIIDLQGSVIAFGGRTMEKDHGGKKYLNTSDTPVYKKSHNLYGLNWAKNEKNDTLVVTEGFMDVISMWQAGFRNIVASQGTAFTAEQARLISRYAKRVILSQDGDAAGQNAIQRSIPVLRATGIEVRVLTIPENLDPDEYIKKYGATRMKLLLDGCSSDVEYSLDQLKVKYDLLTDTGRVGFLRDACGVLGELPPLEREVYAVRLATDLGIDKEAILSQIRSGDRKRHSEESRQELRSMEAGLSGRADKANPERGQHIRAANAEESLLAALFSNPDLYSFAAEKLPAEKMVTSFNRRLYSELGTVISSGNGVDMSQLAARLTPEEMGAASRIFNTAVSGVSGKDEISRFIGVILEESERPSDDQIASASNDDLLHFMEQIRSRKRPQG